MTDENKKCYEDFRGKFSETDFRLMKFFHRENYIIDSSNHGIFTLAPKYFKDLKPIKQILSFWFLITGVPIYEIQECIKNIYSYYSYALLVDNECVTHEE